MIGRITVVVFAVLLLMPVYASAQTPDRISLLDNFGEFQRGEQLFIFGNIASVIPDSYLIMQIINPNGDICQIQQLTTLSNGQFLTEPLPLKGRLCGLVGEYEVRLFYGNISETASFSVVSTTFSEPTGAQYFDAAVDVVSEKIDSVVMRSPYTVQPPP